jgi:hypothetical protein
VSEWFLRHQVGGLATEWSRFCSSLNATPRARHVELRPSRGSAARPDQALNHPARNSARRRRWGRPLNRRPPGERCAAKRRQVPAGRCGGSARSRHGEAVDPHASLDRIVGVSREFRESPGGVNLRANCADDSAHFAGSDRFGPRQEAGTIGGFATAIEPAISPLRGGVIGRCCRAASDIERSIRTALVVSGDAVIGPVEAANDSAMFRPSRPLNLPRHGPSSHSVRSR